MTQRESLPTAVALAFAPLHKRAFGTATGVAGGLLMLLATILGMVRGGEDPSLGLLREYFFGYSVSPLGAVIGFLWGCAIGFVIGWFIAFARNIVMAASIFWIRTRAELRTTRDFLDHI